MKRKKKKGLKIFTTTLVLIIISVFIVPKIWYYATTSSEQRALMKIGYDINTTNIIIKNKIEKEVIKNKKYSKTLEVALDSSKFKIKYLKSYTDLNYKKSNNYIDNINQLFDIGYNLNEVKTLYNKLKENNIELIIKTNKYYKNIINIINDKYFKTDNLSRYINYQDKNLAYNGDKIVNYVNMYLDYDFYKHDIKVNDQKNYLMIVNKYYVLDSNYVPEGLVNISSKYNGLGVDAKALPVVKEAFEKMASDITKENMIIKVRTSYRSYATQKDLYNSYLKNKTTAMVDLTAARPGYSEHQTGLALDVQAEDSNYTSFENTKEYKWMLKNAYKYGFILRYPENKTNITGYNFESWHYRYVGIDVATYIYENNITFEEYYMKFIAK